MSRSGPKPHKDRERLRNALGGNRLHFAEIHKKVGGTMIAERILNAGVEAGIVKFDSEGRYYMVEPRPTRRRHDLPEEYGDMLPESYYDSVLTARLH